jgi:hypothetical protein
MGYKPDAATPELTTKLCQFTLFSLDRSKLRDGFAKDSTMTYERAAMVKIFWNHVNEKVNHVHIYNNFDYLSFFFTQLDTPTTAGFICGRVMLSAGCTETANFNAFPRLKTVLHSTPNCPGGNDLMYVDGNSRGCCMSHGVFAAANSSHCPHLSFLPKEDVHGNTKC